MTVSTTTNKIIQLGDGVTLTFAFPFAARSGGQTDIQVFLTATDGTITQLTYATQYSVVLNAAIAPNPTPVGGAVTTSVAPANGTLVTILRSMSLTQGTSLANQGNLYQPVLESMDDSQEMQLQQLSELQGRAISVAVSDNAPSNLPPAAQRANLAMGFDASGNPIAFSSAPAGVISSAMAPFVGSASIAAAKALLGYGTMANENIGAAGMGIADDGSGNARVSFTTLGAATNQAVHKANHYTAYFTSGSLIFTLDKLTTLFNGFEIRVVCLSGSVALTPNAADTFFGLGGGTSVTIVAGQVATLIGDGTSIWFLAISRLWNVGGQTVTTKTSGSGTYNTPVGATRLKIRFVGGGGGGGGPNPGGGTNGGTGGDTSFNSVVAKGGVGGTAGSGANPGAGGAGGTAGTGSASTRLNGAAGQGGSGANPPSNTYTFAGGTGGPSPFGGNGATNTGSGGLGGGAGATGASLGTGGGGGSGEYVELIINNPAATYTYTVGAAGTAGTGGFAGGAGLIIVDEYY